MFAPGTAPCSAGRYSTGSVDVCSPCPDGGFSNAGSSSCGSCGPGTYKYVSGDGQSCEDCVEGKYTASGAGSESGCESCESGKYSGAGAAYCITVEAGSKANSANTAAVQCDANHFSTGATDTCSPCPDGGFSNAGSSSCGSCWPGTYRNGASCSNCPSGKYTETGASSGAGCLSCGFGTYSVAPASYCATARAGHKTNALQTAEEECPANTFSIGANNTCTNCTGTGFSKRGSSGCDYCGLGKEYNEVTNSCRTCGSGSASLGDTCELCDGDREFAAEDGQPVCDQSSPGEMPNADHTDVIACPKGTDLPGCRCPINTYLGEDGEACEKIPMKGVERGVEGMTLQGMQVLPGFWRTDVNSSDVRPCPVAEACVGGNATTTEDDGAVDYCRVGHTGPYCNLCDEGFAPDAFQLCQECKAGAGDVAFSIAVLVVGLVLLLGLNWLLNKKVFKKHPKIKRSLKTGLKILFVSTQILAALPSIVPAIELPENYKETLESVQVSARNGSPIQRP